MEYTEMTVVELREQLKELGLKIGGTKAELVERLEEAKELVVVEEEAPETEEVVEEVQKTEVDIMPSETPAQVATDPLDDARKHYIGPGNVSGEWIFDDIPGSIAAFTLEEALEKYRTTPGIYKVPGSH